MQTIEGRGDFLSFGPAEVSRRLEERDSLIGQLQRSKAGLIQNYEDMKKQQEEESKVSTDLNEGRSSPKSVTFHQVCVVSGSYQSGSRVAVVPPRLQPLEGAAGGRAGGQGRTAEGAVQRQHSSGSVESQIRD